jgi:branched-chain amino acid transport system permease protein
MAARTQTTQSTVAVNANHRGTRLNIDWHQAVGGIIVVGAALVISSITGNIYWLSSFQLIGLFVAAGILQNFLLHDAGQVSFGQGAILGASAYAVAILNGLHGIPYFLAVPGGLFSGVLVGLLFALPALRVQGYYLGFVTLSAALVFPEMIVAFGKWTNGINGVSLNLNYLHDPIVFGLSPITLMIFSLVTAAFVFHAAIRCTVFGRSLRVSSESAEAAQSLGLNPGILRSSAFLMAALGTAAAGALYAPVLGFVGTTGFGLDLSVLIFFSVIVGGRGQILAPLVGLILLYLLPNILLAAYTEYRLLAYGAVAMAVMLIFPDGLVGAFQAWRKRHGSQNTQITLAPSEIVAQLKQESSSSAEAGHAAVTVNNGVKSFGHVMALDGVSISIPSGEIRGLIGANGSGKTSLLNILSGFSRLSSGTAAIFGLDITRAPPHDIARMGLARTFQTPRIISSLSAWENLQIGLDARHRFGLKEISGTYLDRLQRELWNTDVDWVPHGQRRLMEVLRAALTGAHILLLDEPAAGLSIRERQEFSDLLKRLSRETGLTIILVEHDIDLVWRLTDIITVLDLGKVVASGSPADIKHSPELRALRMGATDA